MTWIALHDPILKTRNTKVKYTMKIEPEGDVLVMVTGKGGKVTDIKTTTIKEV